MIDTLTHALQIVVAVLLVALCAFAAALAAASAWRAFRKAAPLDGLPGHTWQALLFAVVLALLAAAALGVGKALDLLTDGWASIVGVVTALFGGWLGYRAATKISAKGATIDAGPRDGQP